MYDKLFIYCCELKSCKLIIQSMSSLSQETIHLPYCFLEISGPDVWGEVYGDCYEQEWPARSWMVAMLVLGSAWCLVPRQTGDWPSPKRLASSWHKVAINRSKHSSRSYLPGERREQKAFSCTHHKRVYISIFDTTLLPSAVQSVITFENTNIYAITSRKLF